MQRPLKPAQLETFYTDTATADQVRNFLALRPMMDLGDSPVVVDIGGGHGFFARALQREIGGSVRVLDRDPVSVSGALESGVTAALGDALAPVPEGDEQVVCFNLMLHHLIGWSSASTRRMQIQALEVWKGHARFIFITEYCYEGGGWLIYIITRSAILSALASALARFVPRWRANTFGVGVRFRSNREWQQLFLQADFPIVSVAKGREEKVLWSHRVLGISSIRRDTFLLAAK